MQALHRTFTTMTPRFSFWKLLTIAAVCIAITTASHALGDDLAEGSAIYGKLALPMNSVFDGKSFRSALTGIAEQVGLNLCLDRRVDPTSIVEVGPSGPTVYGAIERIAASRDCVVMPVGNVLLVGRPDWVASTTAAVMAIPVTPTTSSAASVDVAWDDLTTPSAAFVSAAGKGATVSPELPHDLWPRTSWKEVNRAVAVALVLAQFDLQSDSSTVSQPIKTIPINHKPTYTRRYSSSLASAVRPAMTQADAKSRFRISGKWLQATGQNDAHVTAVRSIFAALKPKLPDPDKDTFTLKQLRTSAANALQQLCKVAGRRCEINDNARQACETVVTVEGKDATLRELIDLIAEQAGVKATWRDEVISISL